MNIYLFLYFLSIFRLPWEPQFGRKSHTVTELVEIMQPYSGINSMITGNQTHAALNCVCVYWFTSIPRQIPNRKSFRAKTVPVMLRSWCNIHLDCWPLFYCTSGRQYNSIQLGNMNYITSNMHVNIWRNKSKNPIKTKTETIQSKTK